MEKQKHNHNNNHNHNAHKKSVKFNGKQKHTNKSHQLTREYKQIYFDLNDVDKNINLKYIDGKYLHKTSTETHLLTLDGKYSIVDGSSIRKMKTTVLDHYENIHVLSYLEDLESSDSANDQIKLYVNHNEDNYNIATNIPFVHERICIQKKIYKFAPTSLVQLHVDVITHHKGITDVTYTLEDYYLILPQGELESSPAIKEELDEIFKNVIGL
jgi:hypothetical protein